MRIIDITHPPQSLWIGREGENTFRPVSFECANWFSAYPNATIAAYYQPYGASDPYPLVLTVDGTKRIWHPLLAELVKGNGELQIVLMNGDTVGTSAIIPTRVDRSLISSADHPAEGAPSWAVTVVEDVAAEADRAEEAVASIDSKVETSVNEKLPEAVEDYFDEHPVVVDETDPTVPAWAKQPTKPTYTAQEVGALPYDTPIPAAVTEQTVAGWGFTKNTGDYSKPQTGIPKADLASSVQSSLDRADTALQSHQDISGKADTADLAPVATSGNYNDLTDKPTIPAAVTEATVTGWGFTKNTGTYSKPSGGIPASDLASGVIPSVPQMATDPNMSDWTSGKTVDAAALAQDFSAAVQAIWQRPETSELAYVAFSGSYNDLADRPSIPPAVSPSATAPLMDGTAAAGSSAAYARGDHVHPSDTSKLGVSDNAYRSASIPMGHLDATSTATVMTATVDGITELRDGVCMWLLNGVITSASGFTLNVNGLGAKPCYNSLAAATRATTVFNVNYTMLLIYNSTRVDDGCWDIVYGYDSSTTYSPYSLGFGYGTCTTAAATTAKVASISSSYKLVAGGIVSIHFDNDVPANATLNINSKGAKAIYHRGAAITAGVIKAGDTATFVLNSTYYHLIAIDRDESGDDLPSVTASDNGKFLRVVSGAWAAQTVPNAESNSFGGGT